MLKVRYISSSATRPKVWTSRRMAGISQEPYVTTARQRFGRTRGRFSVMPPPVMWARAKTAWPFLASPSVSV